MSVAPSVLGLGQTATVNTWVYPAPADYYFAWAGLGFENLTVTFTKPDGTTDTFMPTSASGGLPPGKTEMIGAIWFYYTPDQVGTWTAQMSFPGQTFEAMDGSGATAYYPPATSNIATFEVVSETVNAGLLNGYPWAELPGPNDYWDYPLSIDNREWSALGGDWYMFSYDTKASKFNPYTTGPNSPHILWQEAVADGGLIGGPWGSVSYGVASASPPIIMMGSVFYNMPNGNFRRQDLSTGEIIYEVPGSLTAGQHIRA
jgi:hypothetical protein